MDKNQQLSALLAQNCSASPSAMGRPETGSRNVIKRLTQSRMISCRQAFCVPPLRKATGIITSINPAAATIDTSFMVQCHLLQYMNQFSERLFRDRRPERPHVKCQIPNLLLARFNCSLYALSSGEDYGLRPWLNQNNRMPADPEPRR